MIEHPLRFRWKVEGVFIWSLALSLLLEANIMNKGGTSIERVEVDLINSIVSDQLVQLGTDAGETILDTILEEGLFNNIPIFGSLYKIGKAGIGIREQFFAKKILKFLFEIKDISEKERLQFIKELEDEEKETGQKAGETLLNLLERLDNLEKPKIVANLLKSKIDNKIDIIQFLRLSAIVEKAFIPDLKKLKHYRFEADHKIHITESLLSLGVIFMSVISGGNFIELESATEGNQYSLTETGKDLLQFGLKE